MVVASVLAATLLPLSSEVVLFGYLKLHPEHASLAIALATLGNTAGGMSTYLMGRLVPERMQAKLDPRALGWLRAHSAPATFLTWLPVIGDAIGLAAGWLRLNWAVVLAFMASGRLVRYLVIAQAA